MPFIAITADHAKLRKVRRELRRKGVTAYLPALVTRRPFLKGRKLKHRRRVTPLMSYILAEATEHPAARDLWLHSILETKDVRSYVAIDGRPALIPARDVEALKAEVKRIRFEAEAKRHKHKIRTGSRASITAGTLAGKIGTVQWIRGKKAGLEARFFGATRTVEVAVSSLEAA